MEDQNEKVKVQTEDGKIVELSKKAAQRSQLLKSLLVNYQEYSILNLNKVTGESFEKIKEYLEHYETEEPKEIQRPLKSLDFKECVDEWDYNFIGKEENIDTLKKLILDANFMNISGLINLLSAKIASKIKRINTPTIRKIFGIKELNEDEKKKFDEDKDYYEEYYNKI